MYLDGAQHSDGVCSIADLLAERLATPAELPSRGEAALLHELASATARNGHTYLSWTQLQRAAFTMLQHTGKLAKIVTGWVVVQKTSNGPALFGSSDLHTGCDLLSFLHYTQDDHGLVHANWRRLHRACMQGGSWLQSPAKKSRVSIQAGYQQLYGLAAMLLQELAEESWNSTC